MGDLQNSLQAGISSFAYYARFPDRLYASICIKLSILRNNPEFFQKIWQVVCSALLIKMASDPQPAPLARLAHVFSTVNIQDGYRLLKLPQTIIFPIDLQIIDENSLLNSLLKIVCSRFNTGYEEDENGNVIAIDDKNIAFYTKAVLEKQFKVMEEKGDAYQTVEEFKAVLQKRFQALKTVHHVEDDAEYDYDFEAIDLESLQMPLRPSYFLSKLEDFIWVIVNFSCIGLYLQDWDLMQTGNWSKTVGHYPGFGWTKTLSLEGFARGCVCSAFFLRLCEAVRQILTEALTVQERRNARWNMICSVFELIHNGAAFIRCYSLGQLNPHLVNILAIIAKSIGLMEIVTRPERRFFDKPASI